MMKKFSTARFCKTLSARALQSSCATDAHSPTEGSPQISPQLYRFHGNVMISYCTSHHC